MVNEPLNFGSKLATKKTQGELAERVLCIFAVACYC
jgi:hypothetical protein